MAEDETTQSPFTRPWFIIAAVLVAVVVVAGVVLAIWTATRGDDPPPADPSPAPPAAPSATPTADAGGASICGLDGVELTGTVTTAPDAEWEYQDVYAYPVSTTAGPGETADEGYRYCFQHTPEGALFAAANVLVQGSALTTADAWFEYVLAPGPYRDQLVADQRSTQPTTTEGTRLSIVGFRVLAYDGTTARVDLAVRGSAQGTTLTLSGVYELVWEGDWKVSTDMPAPMNIAPIPDTAGYTPWGP